MRPIGVVRLVARPSPIVKELSAVAPGRCRVPCRRGGKQPILAARDGSQSRPAQVVFDLGGPVYRQDGFVSTNRNAARRDAIGGR